MHRADGTSQRGPDRRLRSGGGGDRDAAVRRHERKAAAAAALGAIGALAALPAAPARSDTSLHTAPEPSTEPSIAASGFLPPRPIVAAPRHADDSDRSAALVASAIVFGVGAGISSFVYAVRYSDDDDACGGGDLGRCGHPHATPWLFGYGLLVSATPSVPRAVVGDTGRTLLFTGLRATAVLAAVLIHWGDDHSTRWQGPFVLGFAAPVALGIVDLVTTPDREELAPQTAARSPSFRLAPIVVGDGHAGWVGVGGAF
ncbi:MAG: hypothetical protein NVSMB47_03680 [Polyangiales bacterium]